MRAAEALGAEVKADRLNVAEREEVLAYADDVVAHFGAVHQVYNNAGIAHNGNVEKSEFKDIERIMDVDFWGVVNGTKAFLPHVIASGDGHIVNISSLFGLIAVPGQSAYNAAKFAVRGFTEALRQEMLVAGHPVKVTCVHPGGIKTAVARNATVCDGEDAQTFAEFFDRYLALHSPEMAAATIVDGVAQWPCAGGDRLGGQSPRCAVAAHGVGISAGHGHRGQAILPVGQQAMTSTQIVETAEQIAMSPKIAISQQFRVFHHCGVAGRRSHGRPSKNGRPRGGAGVRRAQRLLGTRVAWPDRAPAVSNSSDGQRRSRGDGHPAYRGGPHRGQRRCRDFTHRPAPGDRIAAYPMFEAIDIGSTSRLRPAPLRDPRFVVDVNLGRLAWLLRLLGFDVVWSSDADDETLVDISLAQRRILLTRDRALLKRRIITHGVYVHSDEPEQQTLEVIRRLDLSERLAPFSRCLRCNGGAGRGFQGRGYRSPRAVDPPVLHRFQSVRRLRPDLLARVTPCTDGRTRRTAPRPVE